MNSIQAQIDLDFLEAFKAKNAEKTSVLRLIKSSLKNSEISKKSALSDIEVIKVLQKEISQRRDSIQQYTTGGREDLAAKEAAEIIILEEYLPTQLSDSELEEIVKKAVAELAATTKSDFGKVMARIMPLVAGKSDGSRVSQIVSSLLSND